MALPEADATVHSIPFLTYVCQLPLSSYSGEHNHNMIWSCLMELHNGSAVLLCSASTMTVDMQAHCRALLEAEATVHAMPSSSGRPQLGPGSYNLEQSHSIESSLQQQLKRVRGRQGQIFTSSSRLSPGNSGTTACAHACACASERCHVT